MDQGRREELEVEEERTKERTQKERLDQERDLDPGLPLPLSQVVLVPPPGELPGRTQDERLDQE